VVTCFLRFGADGESEGGAGYSDGDAMMVESVQEGVYQGFTLEEVVPLGKVEVGCNNG